LELSGREYLLLAKMSFLSLSNVKVCELFMEYRGNKICLDKLMDEHGRETVRKHKVFANTLG